MDETIIKDIKREIFRCKEYITKETVECKKWAWRVALARYLCLAISLGLDFAPAFVNELKKEWYSIPTVAFSLFALLLDIHIDKKGYDGIIKANDFHTSELEELSNSVDRKLVSNKARDLTFQEDYIKRITSSLNNIKKMASIPIELV